MADWKAARDADADDLLQGVHVEADLPEDQAVGHLRPDQDDDHQHRAEHLGQHRGNGHAQDLQLKDHHKEQVQDDVDAGGGDEEVQRPLGVSHGPEDAGPHVIDQGKESAAEVDAHIGHGVVHDVLRRTHGPEGPGSHGDAQHRQKDAAGDGKGHGPYGRSC